MLRNRILDEHYGSHPDRDMIGEDRCTGRSTGIALGLIAWCIANPGIERAIYDHHQTVEASHRLCRMIEEILGKLGLRYFVFKRYANGQIKMKFDLFVERP